MIVRISWLDETMIWLTARWKLGGAVVYVHAVRDVTFKRVASRACTLCIATFQALGSVYHGYHCAR